MEQILQYITENKELFSGIVVVVASVLLVGRKRALNFVLSHLGTVKHEVLENIDENAPALARYIYAKLPKTAKLFVTAKVIEKQIHKFIATLDK
jgi:hypothetical protein